MNGVFVALFERGPPESPASAPDGDLEAADSGPIDAQQADAEQADAEQVDAEQVARRPARPRADSRAAEHAEGAEAPATARAPEAVVPEGKRGRPDREGGVATAAGEPSAKRPKVASSVPSLPSPEPFADEAGDPASEQKPRKKKKKRKKRVVPVRTGR
jgi:ribonuclease E